MKVWPFGIATILASCSDAGTYTLYRSSTIGAVERIHVATFDAAQPPAYNRENCETARGLFAQQPGVRARFWCEQGRFSE